MSWNNKQWDKTCEKHNIDREYCAGFFAQHMETLAELPKVSAAIEAKYQQPNLKNHLE